MRFTSILATASAALFSIVAAQENPIHEPIASSVLVAGKLFNITWGPTTKGTISLLLKKGLATNLDTVGTIATDIPNSGAYPWLIPADLVTGSDYAIEIISAAKEINYTPQFVIQGVPASYGSSSSASSTESATASTSTVVSTKSVLSTSVVATKSVYGNYSISTTANPSTTLPLTIHTFPAGTGSAGVPVHTNGTIAISTLKPTGGESTSTKGSGSTTSTTLPRPSTSSPSAAASIQVAFSMMAGAFLFVLVSLL